ncbi:MAG: outer membrane protein assembly factor BamA [Campylobacterota bacterium]|nr:outer membrane protein assembly factor BamA [Campylobacterota bacterium]
MKRFFLLLLLISLPLIAQNFNDIKFSGLTQISNEIALDTLKLENKNSYKASQIDEAIKTFYNFKYFDNIYVTDTNNTLTFHFKEKPFIAKIEMSGYKNREDDLKLLYSTMNIKKGTMYTPKRVQRAKTALLLSLEREGYINSVVEVEVENINDTSVLVKFDVNKGEPIIIDEIIYKGLKSLDISDVEAVIANKEEDCCFTWFFGQNDGEMNFEQLKYDNLRIKDLYLQHGYLDATVTSGFSKVDFNTNLAQIQYTIVEGKQYKVNNTIIYLDETILDPDTLYPELKLEKDDVFNISHLRKDQDFIKVKVANKGYAFAEVNYDIRKNDNNNTVDLVYNVIPGDKVYINDVIISGNNRTLDRVIRRDIYLAHGDLYSLTDFRDSNNALRRTGFFESVQISQKRISSNKMDLVVNVSEAPTGNLVLGGGYGSYDGWMINASVNDKNIFGSGLDLGFSYEHSSKKDTYTLSLANPAIRDSIYNGSFNIHRNESIITNDDNETGDKETIETGFGLGLGRSIGRHTRVGANYSYEDVQVSYELTDTYDSTFVTSSITPYISYNTSDDYYIPRNGIITGTSLKYAGIGGDADYILSSTYFKYFYSLEKATDYDIILRYKNSLRVLEDTGNIPDDTTFYLGGPTSLRGYESYAFQPSNYGKTLFNKYFTNTFEVSFPLIPSAKMRWSLFYDYGMIGEDSFTDIKRAGQGLVVSWYSPVGPLQFIFSRAINPEVDDRTTNFEFSLGSKF